MSDSKSEYYNYRLIQKARSWRFVAFSVVALSIFLASTNFIDKAIHDTDYIAEIKIDGMIIDAVDKAERIKKLQDDKEVKAVIVAINSPGGTTYDSEILYDALQAVAKKKPVVAYMKNIAASGGYIVALSAEKIFAAKNTITGSIGVLMQVPNAEKLMKNIGVSMLEIKSSPIKGEPDYFSESPQEAIDNLTTMVNDTNLWFSNLVKERRKEIKPQDFDNLTNGSVYTGQQAALNKLIDSIGGQEEAKNYIIEKHHLPKTLEIINVSLEKNNEDELIEELLGSFLGYFSKMLGNNIPTNMKHVDGLLSLWHI